ncbi:MAG TPA: hypothetical protein VIZ65_05865 [Cellvibrionaceae bacterium]
MSNDLNRPFYLVSLSKLALLFFATQGGFALVWFFLHWQAQNKTQAKKVYSAPRALFSIFFVGDLCLRLQQEQIKQGVNYRWSPLRLSFVFITAYLLEFATALGIHEQYLTASWQFFALALNLVEFYVLYQFQLVANRVMGDPFGKENKNLTVINILWIGFGLVMWINLLRAWFGDAPNA